MTRLCILVALWPFMLINVAKSTANEVAVDLAKFVIAQNTEARGRLQSFSYTFTRTADTRSRNETVRVTIEGEWRQHGPQKWVRAQRRSQYGEHPNRAQTVLTTALIGHRSAAIHTRGSINPNEYEHDDITRPTDMADRNVMMQFRSDPMLDAFGTGARLLSEELLDSLSGIRFEAERSKDESGKDIFLLRRLLPAASGLSADLVLTVDPNQGWLVTKRLWYTSKEHLEEEAIISPTQDARTERWYPGRVRQVRYAPEAGVQYSIKETVVQSFSSDVTFPPEQFTVASLDLPVGVRLARATTDGQLVTFQVTEAGLKELSRGPIAPMATIPPRASVIRGSDQLPPGSADTASSHSSRWFTTIAIAIVAICGAVIASTFLWKRRREVTCPHSWYQML